MSQPAVPECREGTCTCATDEGFFVGAEAVNRNRVAVGLEPLPDPVPVAVHRH